MLDAYVIESDSLLVGRPKGILDADLARRIVDFIEIKEAAIETGFNRFCDLTRLEGINLTSNDVELLAARRSAYNPNLIRVKSAFLAPHLLDLAVVALYQILLQSPRIEVRVFRRLEEAAEWLGVSPERLKL